MLLSLTIWKIVASLGIWLIELSYVPQIARLYRRKTTDDISLLFPGLNLLGRLMAMSYSIHIGEQVFAIGFMIGSLMRSTLLAQVVYYRWMRPKLEQKKHDSDISHEAALLAIGNVLPGTEERHG